ncbi:MAG: tRNA (adenosine(37)-N6)-threonylcarbamoyltransferase complex dimerization subunit type 1 TsaB [Parasporobacterium sp.]|nr:tRNA (adenosine(37)-N6)-threonylcarbamoyltransferase complex dimerization subunit type 1 TsaB [Parasporobacterium sp.]
MFILALESSGPKASAALWENGQLIMLKDGPFKVTHSETLLPMAAALFAESKRELKELDAIAVSGGPGSFTGLRIGSATAKGLGLALDIPLVHVPTLKAMAYNFYGSDKLLVPIMDARRDQVYTAVYSFKGGQCIEHLKAFAMSITELLKLLKGFGREVMFIGDGIAAFENQIEADAQFAYTFAEEEKRLQCAASVAMLGEMMAEAGDTVSADMESPEYLRPSQAERVREEQGQ